MKRSNVELLEGKYLRKYFNSFRRTVLKFLMNSTEAFETLNEIELKSLGRE